MKREKTLTLLDSMGLLKMARFINRQKPMVLMYHRIIDHPMIPGVSPEVFAEQLDYISSRFRVVSMRTLAEEVLENRIKPYTLALTFDDGHEDFYRQAWPLLKENGLPASLYVATAFIDGKRWLWPDLLRYQLIESDHKEVKVSGLKPLFLDPDSILSTWSFLGDYCLTLTDDQRDDFLKVLGDQLDVRVPEGPISPFSPLNWNQIREMTDQGLEIGSHSVSHPILSQLPDDRLNEELGLSYKRIEEQVGIAPIGVCYPNGMAKDTSTKVEREARQLYRYGVVAYPGSISAKGIMHIGRWAAPNNMSRFLQVVNRMTRNDNQKGEYR